MTEAIFGLVGVALGGLISGGATYLLARHNAKIQARASARLLEDELTAVAGEVEHFVATLRLAREGFESARASDLLELDLLLTPSGGRVIDEASRDAARRRMIEVLRERGVPPPDLSHFSVEQWPQHQARLAEVLDTADWYAVSRAYSAVALGQSLTENNGIENRVHVHSGTAFLFEQIYEQVTAGARALSHLAGGLRMDEQENQQIRTIPIAALRRAEEREPPDRRR